jgi:replicative DNA helicase
MATTQPYSEASERQFIGAALKEPGILDTLLSVVPNPDLFHVKHHQVIYEIILGLYEHSSQFSVFDVDAAIKNNGGYPSGMSRALPFDLADEVASTHQAPRHAEEIRRYATLRRIIAGCQGAIYSATNTDARPPAILADLDRLNTDELATPVKDLEPVGTDIDKLVDPMIAGVKREGEYISSTLPDLDRRLGGLFKGELVFIAAMPSMGKTSLALGIAWENAQRGRPVAFFSLDQTKEQIQQRLIARLSGVPIPAMKRGDLTDRQKDQVIKAAGVVIQNDHLHLTDRNRMTISDVAASCRRMKRRHGLDAVVIDYVQQLKISGRFDRHDLGVADMSAQMKELSKDLHLVVIALSQFSRSYSGMKDWEKPQMTWLRDSGALEQDANVILFPWIPLEFIRRRYGRNSEQYREKCPPEGTDPAAEVIIGKNKDGDTGEVECRWNAARTKFYNEDLVHEAARPVAGHDQDELPF